MVKEEIHAELIKIVDQQGGWESLRPFMVKLKKEDPAAVLDALLGIFFLDNYDDYQCAAGGLLWKLKPKYKRDLREDIKRSLQYWNVSIEELPWYFAEVTSIEKVLSEVESLSKEPLKDIEKRKVQTYLYWLSVSDPAEFRTRLNQGWNGRLRG